MKSAVPLSLALCVGLSGCAMITTEAPLIGDGDTRLQVEPGLWSVAGEEPCATQAHARIADWPECQWAFQVDGSTIRMLRPVPERGDGAVPWRLADGRPTVLQIGPHEGAYAYLAMEPLASEAGRVRRARVFPLFCPEPGQSAPGIRPVPDDGCRAESLEALRSRHRVTVETGGEAVWIAPARDP